MNNALQLCTALGVDHYRCAGARRWWLSRRRQNPGGGWDYANFDAVGGRVFIARLDAVMSIDAATRKVNPKVNVAADAHQALPINGGKQILIINGRTNTVTIVDAITGALATTIHTGDDTDAASFASSPPALHQ